MVVKVSGRNDVPSSWSRSAGAPALVGPFEVLDKDPLSGPRNARNAVSRKYLVGPSRPTASCAVRGRAMDVSTPAQTLRYPRFSGLTYLGSIFCTSHQHNLYTLSPSIPSASSIDNLHERPPLLPLPRQTHRKLNQRTRTPLSDPHACITCPSPAACRLDGTSRRIAPRESVPISRPQSKALQLPPTGSPSHTTLHDDQINTNSPAQRW